MSRKGGRPKDDCWEQINFVKTLNDKNEQVSKCTKCGYEMKSIAKNRREAHFKTCTGKTNSQRLLVNPTEDPVNLDSQASTSQVSSSQASSSRISSSQASSSRISSSQALSVKETSVLSLLERKRKPTVQPTTGKFLPFVVTTAEQKNLIDLLVTQFVYGCNISIEILESPNFVSLINTLRPGYKLPQKYQVEGKLLDKVVNDIKECISSGTEEDGTLLVNCFEGEKVSFFVKSSTSRPKFVAILEKNEKTSISDLVFEAVDKSFYLYKTKIVAVCIDIDHHEESLKSDLELKQILLYFCKMKMIVQYEKLLIDNDLSKLITDVITEVSRKTESSSDIFEESKFPRTHFEKIEFFLNHLEELQSFSDQHKLYLSCDIDVLRNKLMFQRAEQQLNLYDSVKKLKTAAETSLTEFACCWKSVKKSHSIENDKLSLIEMENNFFSITDYVSSIFHPKHRGDELTQEEKTSVAKHILQAITSETLQDSDAKKINFRAFMDFKDRKRNFEIDLLTEDFDPDLYWQTKTDSNLRTLASIALKYVTLPASTIYVSETQHDFDHFGNEQKEKALFVFNSLNNV